MRGTRYPCSVRRTCGQARKHLIGQPFSAFTSCPHSAIGSRAPIGRRDLVLGAPLQVVPPTFKVRALSVPPQNPSRFIPSLLPSHRPSFFTSSVSPCSPPLPPLPARSSWSSLSLEAIESEIENRSRQKISQKRQKSTFLFLVPFSYGTLDFELPPPRPSLPTKQLLDKVSRPPQPKKTGIRRRSEFIFSPGRTRQTYNPPFNSLYHRLAFRTILVFIVQRIVDEYLICVREAVSAVEVLRQRPFL